MSSMCLKFPFLLDAFTHAGNLNFGPVGPEIFTFLVIKVRQNIILPSFCSKNGMISSYSDTSSNIFGGSLYYLA